MPKRKNQLTPQEQRKLFEDEVQKRVADGTLSPTEADAVLDRLVQKAANPIKRRVSDRNA